MTLFRKSITTLCSEEVRVCFFRHSIFKPLQSCSLLQAVQPLAASMGQAQGEFSSVQAAPAAKERHQFPLQVCTFPCHAPLGSANSLHLRCDAARGGDAFHSLAALGC